MCGIVMFGSSIPTSYEMDFFERALICDTFRGYHSTGAFVGYQDSESNGAIIAYAKDVGEGWNFVKSKMWDKIRSVTLAPVGTAKVGSKIYPNFAVGHNRHATMGAKTAQNAHPFQHGDVTLVHNGTMDDVTKLVDNHMFEVDSENICHAINKQGIEETIKQMDGAYTLIWHDSRDNTLNILRNEERPFHLLETTTGEWLGASEEEMLLWLHCRNKYNIGNKYHPVMKRHFECEVGVQYVFDVSDGNFDLKEEIKHELPVFPAYSYYGSRYYGSSSYDYDYGYGSSRKDLGSEKSYKPYSYRDTSTLLLEEAGLKMKGGDIICFQSYQFDEYNTKTTHGKLTGMLPDNGEYVEIQAHHTQRELFVEYGYLYGKVCTAYVLHGVVTIVVSEVSETDPRIIDEDVPPFALEDKSDENVMLKAPNGVYYNKKGWEEKKNTSCGWCDCDIPFNQLPNITEFGGSYICSECSEEVNGEIDSLVESNPMTNPMFTCHSCACDFPVDQESEKDGCCKECHNIYYKEEGVVSLKKKLKNGLIVDYKNWMKINTCSVCDDTILWLDAEKVIFNGAKTSPICLSCEEKLV